MTRSKPDGDEPDASPSARAKARRRASAGRVDADHRSGSTHFGTRWVPWLALLPFVGMLVGPFLLNRVEPLVLGLPLLLAWLVGWVLASAAIMALIYASDPANGRDDAPDGPAE